MHQYPNKSPENSIILIFLVFNRVVFYETLQEILGEYQFCKPIHIQMVVQKGFLLYIISVLKIKLQTLQPQKWGLNLQQQEVKWRFVFPQVKNSTDLKLQDVSEMNTSASPQNCSKNLPHT